MTQRLEVLLDDAEFAEIRRIARRHRMSVAEWVRKALRAVRSEETAAEPGRKLLTVREAAANSFPTADLDQMLAETQRGYVGARER